MQPALFLRSIVLILCLVSMEACTFNVEVGTAVPSSSPSQPNAAASLNPSANSILVAYVKSRNLYIWDSSTNQTRDLVTSGDVTDVKISDDGERIAFVRWVVTDPYEIQGEASLWVVDRTGEHVRVLVPANILHQRLNVQGTGSSVAIGNMTWIPRTHRLIYYGEAGDAGGEILGQAGDVYVVDIDTLSDTLLAPAGSAASTADVDGPQLVLSPDGTQVAMISGTQLSFVNVDGSNLRQRVFQYPIAGAGDTYIGTTGVWTQDSRAVLLNAPMGGNFSEDFSFSITRVPVDGSPAEVVGTVPNSLPNSLAYSPDGKRIAFRSQVDSNVSWQIMPLGKEVGPLAIPSEYVFEPINLHWSPAGDAYFSDQGNFWHLCPDAASSSEVCGDPAEIGNIVVIRWIDPSRFLFVTSGPSVLFLYNKEQGTSIPVATWPLEEYQHPFSATLLP